MNNPPGTIRHSELINQLILDRTTTEELGRVEVLWMYPEIHRVLGFVGKSGWLGQQKFAFRLDQIYAIGSSGVLIEGRSEKTDADHVRRLESLIQHEIWSDEGNRIGKITDCLFDLQTGEISHYLYVSSGWSGITGDLYQLPVQSINSFGKERVLVSESAVPYFGTYREGLPTKFIKVRETLTHEAVEEWRSLTEQAQTATEQAKDRFQQFTELARAQALRLSEQAKSKFQELREETQTLAHQVQEKGQTVIADVMEPFEQRDSESDFDRGFDDPDFEDPDLGNSLENEAENLDRTRQVREKQTAAETSVGTNQDKEVETKRQKETQTPSEETTQIPKKQVEAFEDVFGFSWEEEPVDAAGDRRAAPQSSTSETEGRSDSQIETDEDEPWI
jgi:uncharacterized protein YrrD